MREGFARQVGLCRHVQGSAFSHAVTGTRRVLLGLLITPHPRRQRTWESGVLQRIDGVDAGLRRNIQPQLAQGASSDLGEKGIELELHRLGGQNLFGHSLFPPAPTSPPHLCTLPTPNNIY